MAIFHNLVEYENDPCNYRLNFNLLNTIIIKKEKINNPYSAYFKILHDGEVQEEICLNFESQGKYEDWMSTIIKQKKKQGDKAQINETLKLALRFGIKDKDKYEGNNSDQEDDE